MAGRDIQIHQTIGKYLRNFLGMPSPKGQMNKLCRKFAKNMLKMNPEVMRKRVVNLSNLISGGVHPFMREIKIGGTDQYEIFLLKCSVCANFKVFQIQPNVSVEPPKNSGDLVEDRWYSKTSVTAA